MLVLPFSILARHLQAAERTESGSALMAENPDGSSADALV